jgi:hypothetical protein
MANSLAQARPGVHVNTVKILKFKLQYTHGYKRLNERRLGMVRVRCFTKEIYSGPMGTQE